MISLPRVEINYEFRIVIDYNFFKWLKNLNLTNNASEIKTYLMHIKASSKFHRRKHNLILPISYNKIISEQLYSIEDIGAYVKLDDDYKFANADELEQVIKYSKIISNNELPYKVCILTSPEFQEKYNQNEHFKTSKNVIVKSGNLAIEFLKFNYKLFTESRADRL